MFENSSLKFIWKKKVSMRFSQCFRKKQNELSVVYVCAVWRDVLEFGENGMWIQEQYDMNFAYSLFHLFIPFFSPSVLELYI